MSGNLIGRVLDRDRVTAHPLICRVNIGHPPKMGGAHAIQIGVGAAVKRDLPRGQFGQGEGSADDGWAFSTMDMG
jgi:hypothetical protein